MSSSVLVLNYAGDFCQAYTRLSKGGPEYYFAQRYTVGAVCKLTGHFDEVIVVDCRSDTEHETTLENGIRVIGLGLKGSFRDQVIINRIEHLNPSHIILRFLHWKILYWAIRKSNNVSVISASSLVFAKTWKGWFHKVLISRALNSRRVQWVSTYGLDATWTFANAGVKPEKLIPHDFFVSEEKEIYPAKQHPPAKTFQLVYIGNLTKAKGVNDIFHALTDLRDQGHDVRLTVIGSDSSGTYAKLSEKLGLQDRIDFAGMIENGKLEAFIRPFDALVAPSHHSYNEGFPLVFSHAMRARLPIITSDHPMFVNVLRHKETALVSKEQDVKGLAENIAFLMRDVGFYNRASQNSMNVLRALPLPVKFEQVLLSVYGGTEEQAFLRRNSLKNTPSPGRGA